MQYKDILVYLDNGDSNASRVETALSLAKTHGAHLMGLALEADETSGLTGLMKTPTDILENPEVITDAFLEQAESAGIRAEAKVLTCLGTRAPRKVAAYARNFDLTVMRQLNPENSSSLDGAVAEEVLFGSGRPVLYIPFSGARSAAANKAVVGWDGSRATARAIHDALPMLKNMDKVVLLIIGKSRHRMSTAIRRADTMLQHLARHEVKAEVEFALQKHNDVGMTILSYLDENNTDLLVMGGYGSSRLRELIFGGVTDTIFKRMNTPVCMSH